VHDFAVWAPLARRAELDLGPGRPMRAMHPGSDGWWHLEVDDAGHGTDYGFRLDGDETLPDPRSAWQPYGVHGLSRVFDPGLYRWSDGDWPGRDVLGAVFYELHVGTFTPAGTLDAALEHLDHLVGLGVDVVELMPVAAMPGRHGWGYDGVGLYAVHEPYGGPAALQRFVDACHVRGMAVCLDVVYNHLGPEGNYLPWFGPYFTENHATPWGEAINLDGEGSAQVRRFVVDNALRWFEDFHLDCLRLDAVHALADDSHPHLLAQMSEETAALAGKLGRPLALVVESDLNDPRVIEPLPAGLGMTAQWSDDFHHALHALLTGERQGYYVDFGSPEVLGRTLTEVYRHAGDHSTFRRKPWGRPVDRSRHRGHHFLGYAQTHDQVGNRAAGERLGALVGPDRLAAAAALVLTSPFTPMLFMGEEWGADTPWQFFSDFGDAELIEGVREGRREEFSRHGWDAEMPDPHDPATREASVLDWSQPPTGVHARVLSWYTDLIRLRRREPDLRDDDLSRVRVDLGAGWVAVRRGGFDVVVNLSDRPVAVPSRGVRAELAWGGVEPGPDGTVRVAPGGTCVLRLA
jgi:maltooligosyltrehalose trehalohydrolase